MPSRIRQSTRTSLRRKIEGASGIDAMWSTLGAYQSLDTAGKDLSFAAVLYHGASIAYGFDDTVWDRYIRALLPKGAIIPTPMDADIQTVISITPTGNPVRPAIENLTKNCSAQFFVCNNAFSYWTKTLAEKLHRSHLDMYNDAKSHLMPYATLVPAGVWAVHAIQEHGFTLLHTT